MAKRSKKKTPTKLSDVLVLNRYILHLFGVNDFEELAKDLKTSDIEVRLNDPDVTLSSFIISNTPYDQIKHWQRQTGMADFNAYNVYFQREQQYEYVGKVLEKVINKI